MGNLLREGIDFKETFSLLLFLMLASAFSSL
jgi:hypothetical protein